MKRRKRVRSVILQSKTNLEEIVLYVDRRKPSMSGIGETAPNAHGDAGWTVIELDEQEFALSALLRRQHLLQRLDQGIWAKQLEFCLLMLPVPTLPPRRELPKHPVDNRQAFRQNDTACV
jgi:hypothetical protein